jgi:hypothetical protein
LLSLAAVVASLAASPSTEPPTLMAERGKLLFHDPLGAAPGKAWKVAKGTWEPSDGALVGTEVKAEKHGAVMRHAEKLRNAVIQYAFKLDGAKTTTLSLNTAKAHLCRVVITPTVLRVQKDDSDHDGPDKAAVLQNLPVKIAPGEWHTLVVELVGNEMLASLDGKHVAFGANDALDVDKANLGLTVAGASVAFKDLSVWEARPNADWGQTKAKLLAARTKTASAPR